MTQEIGSKKVKRRRSYAEVRDIVEKRGMNRIIGGEEFRGYSLTDTKLRVVLDKWRLGGVFVSPYSEGVRSDHLKALAKLGINRAWHLGTEIKPALRTIMEKIVLEGDRHGYKNRWERFCGNERGDKPSDVTERIYDNYRSFRRLCLDGDGHVGFGAKSPYGMRLWQMGCCIDIFTIRKKFEIDGEMTTCNERYIRLNTFSRVPLFEVVLNRKSIPSVNERGKAFGPRTAHALRS